MVADREGKMADNFCTHCGSRLTGTKKFCANCGKAIAPEPVTSHLSQSLQMPDFERLSARFRIPDSVSLLLKPQASRPGWTTAPVREQPQPGGDRPSPDQVAFERVTEPNDHAFTVSVPKGWQVRGGIFYIDPLQVNGPGNTLSPKCDFAVMSDGRGAMRVRWMPSWNYADLTYAQGIAFMPGQWYQGMPVRLMVTARQFLCEMLQAERPRATGMKLISEDPMDEITAAFYRQAEEVNRNLQQMGLAPLQFQSWSMRVEYVDDGRAYWEEVTTTLCDNRVGAFMWTNDNTVMTRAPLQADPGWGRVLVQIRSSVETNKEWLAAVEKARGERARIAWETQQYLNRAAAEMAARRERAYEEARRQREREDARREREEAGQRRGGGDNQSEEE
jgi:hypothetical protein